MSLDSQAREQKDALRSPDVSAAFYADIATGNGKQAAEQSTANESPPHASLSTAQILGYTAAGAMTVGLGVLAARTRVGAAALRAIAAPFQDVLKGAAVDSSQLKSNLPEILTADPLRTLIQVPGYGGSPTVAAQMEKIIAGARQGYQALGLGGPADIEYYIVSRYERIAQARENGALDNELSAAKAFRPNAPRICQDQTTERIYLDAAPLEKHVGFSAAVDRLLGEKAEHTATATLSGETFELLKTARHDQFGWTWHPPRLQAPIVDGLRDMGVELPKTPTPVVEAVNLRTEQLFDQLLATSKLPESPSNLEALSKIVAERGWLDSNLWKYKRGSGAVSQMADRTWLELAGVDSGRFKEGTDGNIEALTRSLPDYIAVYPKLFERPPEYFSVPKEQRQFVLPRLDHSTELPKAA